MRARITAGFSGGTLPAPPSKSMAHRALLCAALATGVSHITGIAPSEDMRATMRAMACLGAEIAYDEATHTATVRGAMTDASQTAAPPQPTAPVFPPVQTEVDCGESGSTLRFVIPLFSLTNAPVTLVGHGRLPERPQGVYADLFAARGLAFAQTERGVFLHGALTAGEYAIDGSVSSQFISGLLFALPLLHGDSVLRITPPFESRSYVLLTLQVLADFGVRADWLDENTLCISGKQKYKAFDYTVEGDCSQAAFFAVLAACLPHSANAAVTLINLRADTQQGDRVIFDILQRCGARLVHSADGSVCVQPSREALHGVEIDLADCPDLGPVLMVLGLFCAGETVIRNAGRLRVKESDRIAAMEEEIRKIGGEIRSEGDTVFLRSKNTKEESKENKEDAREGCGNTAALPFAYDGNAGAETAQSCDLHPSACLTGHGDHRIVMAMAVAAAAAGFSAPCEIGGAQAIHKSYPAFFADLSALGGCVELLD